MAMLVQKDVQDGAPCRDFFCTGKLRLMAEDEPCQCSVTRPPCWICTQPLRFVCDKCEKEIREE